MNDLAEKWRDIGVGSTAANAMARENITPQAARSLSDAEILRIPSVGRTSLRQIRDAVASTEKGTAPFVSKCCEGEKCHCGAPADHKVEEVVFDDDPYPARHPLTSYICDTHFCEVMGPEAVRRSQRR